MSDQDIPQQIGQRIHSARREKGWTRQKLSVEADVSERYLAQLEKGGANVSIVILLRIIAALEIDYFDLLTPLNASSFGERMDSLAVLLKTMTDRERKQSEELLRRHIETKRRALCGLALIGLRGAGKSTMGRILAQKCKVPFIRLTSEIEANAGIPVEEIFALGGQDSYRRLEAEAIDSLIEKQSFIILETSGGIVANTEVYGSILTNFRTVWLKASPEQHMERVINQGDMRPISGHDQAMDHLRSLLNARSPAYGKADYTLNTSEGNLENCISELLRLTAPLLNRVES